MRLTIGQKYKLETLEEMFTGWNQDPEDFTTLGYNLHNYFEDGVYLGPDKDGIEPIFEDTD